MAKCPFFKECDEADESFFCCNQEVPLCVTFDLLKEKMKEK